jgi:hypothetical protein
MAIIFQREPGTSFRFRVSGNSLIAWRLGSQEAGSDEASELSGIQAFQPSSYFADT